MTAETSNKQNYWTCADFYQSSPFQILSLTNTLQLQRKSHHQHVSVSKCLSSDVTKYKIPYTENVSRTQVEIQQNSVAWGNKGIQMAAWNCEACGNFIVEWFIWRSSNHFAPLEAQDWAFKLWCVILWWVILVGRWITGDTDGWASTTDCRILVVGELF